MAWEVEYTAEFDQWWETLGEAERRSVRVGIEKLELVGPSLGRPHADTVKGSRHANMKELRAQHASDPFRIFFAFDPRRSAILLIGGSKSGDNRFYKRMIPLADQLYDEYLEELRKEGLI